MSKTRRHDKSWEGMSNRHFRAMQQNKNKKRHHKKVDFYSSQDDLELNATEIVESEKENN